MAASNHTFSVAIPAKEFEKTIQQLGPQHRGSLKWLYETILAERWSLAEVGKHLNIHPSNVSRILRNTYGGNTDAMIYRIEAFRDKYIAENGTVSEDFVETPESQAIFAGCEKIINAREIGLIYGPLGGGKTISLKEFAKRGGSRIFYYRCPSSASFGTFLRKLCAALGIPARGNLDSLRESILIRFGKRGLDCIIVDEFHQPFITSSGNAAIRIAEYVREIWDALEIGIVLCGTKVLPNALKEGEWAEALRQTVDRGNTTVNLGPRLSLTGLEPLFAKYDLELPEGDARDQVLATLRNHSIRKLVFQLRDALRAASKRGESMSWDYYVDACAINQALADGTLIDF